MATQTGGVNLSPGAGLFFNELNRFQNLLKDRSKELYKYGDYGICRIGFGADADSYFGRGSDFLCSAVGSTRGSIYVNSGEAVDVDGNLIVKSSSSTVSVHAPALSGYFYVTVQYASSHYEEGTVTVERGASGSEAKVIGVNTKFTELFRGSDLFYKQNFIKFGKSDLLNTGTYEVAVVRSDTDLSVLGSGFVPESNLSFSVVSTFSGGLIPATDDKYTYYYDSYLLKSYQVASPSTPPPSTIDSTKEFLLCMVSTPTTGNSVVTDLREQFWDSNKQEAGWSTYAARTGIRTAPKSMNPSAVISIPYADFTPYYFIDDFNNMFISGYARLSAAATVEAELFRVDDPKLTSGQYRVGRGWSNPKFSVVGFYLNFTPPTASANFDDKVFSFNAGGMQKGPLIINSQGRIFAKEALPINTELYFLGNNTPTGYKYDT
jgi:hypothetical protein